MPERTYRVPALVRPAFRCYFKFWLSLYFFVCFALRCRAGKWDYVLPQRGRLKEFHDHTHDNDMDRRGCLLWPPLQAILGMSRCFPNQNETASTGVRIYPPPHV